ncbi:hypothetical protein [Bacillus thuringiensis]|jgi:hypothetical protein|uniref:hypothetical protein n=1 Tax=Bacillus cereus group TaxID=86661 RepID=UPI002DBABE6A|nr:hypothetical protein [Bacillus thuringiensis]MEC3554284.1 hypothetical protein [Bacillus thuringiensis]MED2694145.1 hypothetical protein [Bacillus thuringiensis]
MEIHIRKADPYYIKEIDKKCEQISKKIGKRYTRSDFINALIEDYFEHEYRRVKGDKFDEAVSNIAVSLERQEQKLQEYIDTTNELIHTLGEKE